MPMASSPALRARLIGDSGRTIGRRRSLDRARVTPSGPYHLPVIDGSSPLPWRDQQTRCAARSAALAPIRRSSRWRESSTGSRLRSASAPEMRFAATRDAGRGLGPGQGHGRRVDGRESVPGAIKPRYDQASPTARAWARLGLKNSGLAERCRRGHSSRRPGVLEDGGVEVGPLLGPRWARAFTPLRSNRLESSR